MKQIKSILKTYGVSDNHRIPLFGLIVLLLFLLGAYSHSVGLTKDETFRQILVDCLSEVEACPQQLVVLSAQVKNVKQGHFIVNIRTKKGPRWEDHFDREHDLKVLGEGFELTVGSVIALKGHFFSPQILILEEYETEDAWAREIKYGISLFALGLTVLLWRRNFSFSLRQFIFFRKENR